MIEWLSQGNSGEDLNSATLAALLCLQNPRDAQSMCAASGNGVEALLCKRKECSFNRSCIPVHGNYIKKCVRKKPAKKKKKKEKKRRVEGRLKLLQLSGWSKCRVL